jgi:hypothetical protein
MGSGKEISSHFLGEKEMSKGLGIGFVLGCMFVFSLGANSQWISWAQKVDARLAALEAKTEIAPTTQQSDEMIGAEFGWSQEEQELFDRIMTHQKDKHKVSPKTINYMGSPRQSKPAIIETPINLNERELSLWENMKQLRK